MFFDTTYLLWVLLPTVLLSGAVQLYLRRTYGHWRQVRNSAGADGTRVAEMLMHGVPVQAGGGGSKGSSGVQPVAVQSVRGELTDHYDPRANVVRLSEGVATQPSVASMAIVAHELGHVQQHQQRSPLILARNFLVPAITVSPMVSYIAIFAGLMLSNAGLLWAGIVLFGVMVFFTLLTLPVEFDASRRGLALLRASGLMQTQDDATGARRVLTAAALTYVAAAVTAVLQLLYFVALARRE